MKIRKVRKRTPSNESGSCSGKLARGNEQEAIGKVKNSQLAPQLDLDFNSKSSNDLNP